ncbi:MAG: hypothetical protein ACREP6_13085 [Candidatus Binataceae bacterium]
MKPRNREVNIFNMSVLDLLTGALGAFCFLTLALFPYYFKAQEAHAIGSDATGLKAANDQLAKQIAASKSAAGKTPPFALLSVTAQGAGSTCTVVKLKAASGPSGASGIASYPGEITSKGPVGLFLLAFRPGPYRITLELDPFSAPCKLYFSNIAASSWTQTRILTSSRQQVEFDFQVSPADFYSSLFDNG